MREDFHTSKDASGDGWPGNVVFDPPPRPRRFPIELALRWTPVRSRSDDTGPLNVLIEQMALRQIRQHVLLAGHGAAGLLTGDLNRCPETGQLWLSVEQATPGSGSVPDDAGADSLDGIVAPLIREQALRGHRAIGWYHVHSALGVFLSAGEAEFHELRFPEVWQVAVVLLDDPEKPAAGVFLRAPNGDLSRSGYVSFYERLHRSSLLPEGRKRSFVAWTNHSTEEPVVVAGSDGVTDDLVAQGEPAEAAASLPSDAGSPPAARSDLDPLGGEIHGAGGAQYGGVTPGVSAPDAEAGLSEEAHDRAQMKRALSAVDFSISPLPEPIPPAPPEPHSPEKNAGADGGSADAGRAKPAPTDSITAKSRQTRGSRTDAPPTTATPTGQIRPAAGPQPEFTPSVQSIDTPVERRSGGRLPRRRLSRIGWSTLGLLLVGALLWLAFMGGRRSVSGEPVGDGSATAPIDARDPEIPAVADAVPSQASPSTSSSEEPVEVDLAPEIVPPPAAVIADDPFDSADFLAAVEIFGQESAGYEERQEAYERGLVGCNALNSWYRSVGDAFVRLSSKVVEAGPEHAAMWSAGYEDAQMRMDHIDRHYLASGCPLPP